MTVPVSPDPLPRRTTPSAVILSVDLQWNRPLASRHRTAHAIEERKIRDFVDGGLNRGGVILTGRCDCLFDGEDGKGDSATAVACEGEVADSIAGLERLVDELAGTVGIDPLAVNRGRRLRSQVGCKHEGGGAEAQPAKGLRSFAGDQGRSPRSFGSHLFLSAESIVCQ